MDTKKQKLLIEYLLSSTDTFSLCSGIVRSEYFDPEFRNSVSFIRDYFEEYHTTPDPVQVEAESGIEFKKREIRKDQISYCADEIETFCKRKAIEQAILSSPSLIDKGDYGGVEAAVKDALMVSLNRNLGLRYFATIDERIERMMTNGHTEPTGWDIVDELLFGGISRKELILFAANSGGGKSITLANLGVNFVEKGLNVLYISLELSEDIVAQRFDTMFTGISRKDWKERSSEVGTRVKAQNKDGTGVLDIVQMKSGTTANDIRAYLKEYYLHYDMMPDLLVCDYLDKMNPNEKVSADNVFEKDKRCSEQLRDIGIDHNMFIATASQLNRSAVGATHHDHSQIAGGISKINESDIYISIVLDDIKKAAGEIMFSFQKTRNSDGVGKVVHLKWDNKYLRIRNPDNNQEALKFVKSDNEENTSSDDSSKPKSSLLDLMGD